MKMRKKSINSERPPLWVELKRKRQIWRFLEIVLLHISLILFALSRAEGRGVLALFYFAAAGTVVATAARLLLSRKIALLERTTIRSATVMPMWRWRR